MNDTVRTASIEWTSLHIQRGRPDEPRPQQLAEELVRIAEDEHIMIEDLVEWVNRESKNGPLTASAFQYWAAAHNTVCEMQRKQQEDA